MGFRKILIIAAIVMVSTFVVAQAQSAPAATSNGAAPTAPAIQAPGQSNVPLGINAVGAGSGTANTPVPTTIVVPATSGFIGPAQSFPLVTTPTLTFVNSPDGTGTVGVVNYGSGRGLPNSSGSAANAAPANTGATQMADLNLGNVSSISELYGGDNRSVAEVARMYKARKNGVQNARVYTNADIARIRQQEGAGSSAVPANDQRGAMPASDQSAEQNQGTTPQVPQPANQKPSPFAPKK